MSSSAELAVGFPPPWIPAEVERWNAEWLEYLRREWPWQLAPYTAYPDRPPLPADPSALLDLHLGFGFPLALYCDREALAGRRVMEIGCGCGNLGKLLGRYVASYLGTDSSTLALAVARLVSPANCQYVHPGDEAALAPFLGTIETVVSRYFWIHQNLAMGRHNLAFLGRFVVPGGLVYCDFFWPDPAVEQFVVLTPDAPSMPQYPSATFRYAPEDLARLLAGQPFELVREELNVAMQRRYVVLRRRAR